MSSFKLAVVLLTTAVFSQTATLKGTIQDWQNKPVPACNVSLTTEGSTVATDGGRSIYLYGSSGSPF